MAMGFVEEFVVHPVRLEHLQFYSDAIHKST